jgi:hypothetical protein
MGNSDEKLGFGTRFQTVVKRLAKIHNILNHLAVLVYFYWVNRPKGTLVGMFPEGVEERVMDYPEAVGENVSEADQSGEFKTPHLDLLNQVFDIDTRTPPRPGQGDVPSIIHREYSLAPPFQPVKFG